MNNEKQTVQMAKGNYKFATVQLPTIIEKQAKDWVLYGGDNLFPNFVVDLYNKSSMNRRCIQAKADALCGKGLTTNDSTKEYLLTKANPEESWNEIFEKCALDYITFGGYALNVIWSNDGTTISEIYHLDFAKVRSGKLNEDDKIEHYFYCYDWKQTRKYVPKRYCAFSSVEAQEDKKMEGDEEYDTKSQILYVKDYQSNQVFYPLPQYCGAMNDIQLDIQVSQFHNSNLANGITPSMWIHFPDGVPSSEGRQKLWNEISDSYAGSENGGRFFLTFSDSQESAPTVTPLTVSNDGYYLALDERVSSRILSGHGISSPLLLGLRVGSSGLGSNADEIETAYTHFIFSVIRPLRKPILKTFNTLAEYRFTENVKLDIVPEVIFKDATMVEPTKEGTS